MLDRLADLVGCKSHYPKTRLWYKHNYNLPSLLVKVMIGKFSAKSCKIALCLPKSKGFLLSSSNTSSVSLN